ncbi:MAG TPA: pirin family protein [Planctomycetota bacterium]|nr:pirin family protein [Planctomycetota bacterium]
MIRPVSRQWKSRPTIEGAGVHLRRGFGFQDPHLVDPFLLFDDFRNENPEDYRAGFPWHPHRGIETITYVLDGDVEHADSLGHQGVIGAGDVQWMTAGDCILHQEMPRGDRKGRMFGFQLWSNLPRASKRMEPRYREVKAAEIPVVKTASGAVVRVVAGALDGVQGPVRDVMSGPEYLDVRMPPDGTFVHDIPLERTAFAYVFEGEASFGGEPADDGTVVLFGPGTQVRATTAKRPSRFLLVSGTPLREPIAWYGPIVMNTQDELRQAFAELKAGTFAKR